MKNTTRQAFNAYLNQLASLNGVEDATQKFAVEPSVTQKLQDRMRESTVFLQLINMIIVDEMKGETLGLDVAHPVASRTDTSGAGRRVPFDPTSMDGRTYECAQTNFDTSIKYNKLDQWAKFPDFQNRMRNAVVNQQARDLIMMGFNGTSRAANSNRVANPLLQDVAIGWLQYMRDENQERTLSGVKIGDQAGADYKNIDQAVMAATQGMLAEWWRDAPDLVAICGSDLVADKYISLAGDHDAPTERTALETMLINKKVGGKKSITAPFFPANAFMVTPLNNLSIYEQDEARRRHVKDEPEADQIADYQSTNLDYVVEDYSAALLVEGIQVPDGAGGWQ